MLHRKTKPTFVDLIEDEFAQEKASALGRLGRALEARLAALARFDASHAREAASAEQRQLRAALVAEASVALWHFAVQREACGLRDMRYVLRDYGVPPEVAARMGVLPTHPRAAAQAERPAHRASSETTNTGDLCQAGFCTGGPAQPFSPPPVSAALKPDRISLLPADLRPTNSTLKGPYA